MTSFDFNAHQRTQPFDANNPQHRTMPELKCADGFSMSVQASYFHYCTPDVSGLPYYSAVEVGFPSSEEPTLMEYADDSDAPTETVYGRVPVGVVNAIINAHGGLANHVSAENPGAS